MSNTISKQKVFKIWKDMVREVNKLEKKNQGLKEKWENYYLRKVTLTKLEFLFKH